ncbi:MAG TPA: Fe-S cluster assembly protein SufD [Nevskiales bacterium]|nr:Fe-S cluster assembly protein SufD [Nevskiales bacterium]
MTTPVYDHYLGEHARLAAQLPGDGWLRELRATALQRFVEAGFPATSQEDWKYTDLRALQKLRPQAAVSQPVDAAAIQALRPAGLDAHRLVFVNGHYAPQLSEIGPLPAGAQLGPLAVRLAAPDEALRVQLGATVNGSRTALTDLNTAFVSDGLWLQLADGVALERPVHVLFIGLGDGMVHARNLLQLGRNSAATVIEHYVGLAGAQTLTTAVTEVQAGPDARLVRSKLQQEAPGSYHFGGFYLDLARGSEARLHGIDLGGRLVRNDTHGRLQGPGASIQMDGVYAPGARQHIDNHTRIDHLQPAGRSRETYKGVIDAHGRGVFNGKIVVHPNAQKTDSEQSSAALLLAKNAEVDAKPELEIYADDVKCAHGATVGQLDETAVFYLQSRGVDQTSARNILTYSFADEVIRRVGIEALRRHIEAQFMAKLPNGPQLRELL